MEEASSITHFLALEEGTSRLSWNVRKELPLHAALFPRRAQISKSDISVMNFTCPVVWCGIIDDIGDGHVFSSHSLQFLEEVASHSGTNKMDVKNLAIIIAPSIMPVEERIVVSGTSRLSHHVQVVEVRT